MKEQLDVLTEGYEQSGNGFEINLFYNPDLDFWQDIEHGFLKVFSQNQYATFSALTGYSGPIYTNQSVPFQLCHPKDSVACRDYFAALSESGSIDVYLKRGQMRLYDLYLIMKQKLNMTTWVNEREYPNWNISPAALHEDNHLVYSANTEVLSYTVLFLLTCYVASWSIKKITPEDIRSNIRIKLRKYLTVFYIMPKFYLNYETYGNDFSNHIMLKASLMSALGFFCSHACFHFIYMISDMYTNGQDQYGYLYSNKLKQSGTQFGLDAALALSIYLVFSEMLIPSIVSIVTFFALIYLKYLIADSAFSIAAYNRCPSAIIDSTISGSVTQKELNHKLHIAIKNNNISSISALIISGASLNTPMKYRSGANLSAIQSINYAHEHVTIAKETKEWVMFCSQLPCFSYKPIIGPSVCHYMMGDLIMEDPQQNISLFNQLNRQHLKCNNHDHNIRSVSSMVLLALSTRGLTANDGEIIRIPDEIVTMMLNEFVFNVVFNNGGNLKSGCYTMLTALSIFDSERSQAVGSGETQRLQGVVVL